MITPVRRTFDPTGSFFQAFFGFLVGDSVVMLI